MESPDILLSTGTSCNASEPDETVAGPEKTVHFRQKRKALWYENLEQMEDIASNDKIAELQNHAVANLQKPNVPNVNIPERIIICLDVCYDDQNTLYKLADGTTYRAFDMLKRVLEFLLHSKLAINKKTEFALLVINDKEANWVHYFTSNIKDIIGNVDHLSAEQSTSETYDFKKVFDVLKQNIQIPELKKETCVLPPAYVTRMIVLYGRSNCIPVIPQDDDYFKLLRKQLYFYTDILLAHEEECVQYKCEEIFDALQYLDNGYSYVFEVTRNPTKIHEMIAKLLAHPLQRPLQKKTKYSFGSKHELTED